MGTYLSQPAYSTQLHAYEKYEHLAPFRLTFLIQSLDCRNDLFLKQVELFIHEVIWIYTTATAVNEKRLVIYLVDALDKPLQLDDIAIALLCSAQCRTDFKGNVTRFKEQFHIRAGTSKMWSALNQPHSFDFTILKSLEAFMMSTILG